MRVLSTICCIFVLFLQICRADQVSVVLATGVSGGVYSAIGGGICRFVNRAYGSRIVKCKTVNTFGSVDNINRLYVDNELLKADLAIVQPDVALSSYRGDGIVGSLSDLRSLIGLYDEFLTIVVRDDSNIKSVSDLESKMVGVGSDYTGVSAIWNSVLHASKITNKVGVFNTETAAVYYKDLCNRDIDAVIGFSGYTKDSFDEFVSCPIRIVNIDDELLNYMIKLNKCYKKVKLEQLGDSEDRINTIATTALLVTRSKLDKEVSCSIVRSVLQNINNMKSLHRCFASLDIDNMLNSARIIPVHSGVHDIYDQYFGEK